MSGAVFTIRLTGLAYGGEAIGRLPDGRAVFVPFALPGETVHLRLVEEKRGFARAALLEVISPAPQRIQPPCPHFGECGGCHYQHLSYADQLTAKQDILRDQLERIGRLPNPPVRPTVPSPQPSAYRNHIQFALAPDGKLGYHRPRSESVLPVQTCLLPEPALAETWPQLDFEAMPEIERIGLRLGAGNELQLILESQVSELPELSVEELPVSVVHISPAGSLVLAGSPALEIDVLGRAFQVSAASFFQVNTPMAEKMVQHILETLRSLAALGPSSVLIDAYCGVGLFSAFLAGQVGELVGIEASPSAVEDFTVNLDEFENVSIYEAPVESVLPGLDLHPNIVLLDPPRDGLLPAALDGLLRLAPQFIVYVSCDPATLARDARRLVAGGYTLLQVTPFDLFPQTYHIESVSFWQRAA